MTATYVPLSDGSYAEQTVSSMNATSTTDAASVAAPAAGVTISTIANLPIGTYDIEVLTFIGGTTVAATEATNMRLTAGATPVARVLNPVPGTSGGVGLGQLRVRVVLTVATTISVVAVATATAGSLYSASIVAKKVM